MESLPTFSKNDLFETEFTPYADLPGFFPGAGGFFHGHPKPRKRFLFFGTDFGPLSYQQGLQSTGGESQNVATIQNLRAILLQATLPLRDCFLTNAVLCMRRGESATDDFPIWQRHEDYVMACVNWHRRFIAEHKPEAIVLMGLPHLKYFGKALFSELGPHWAGLKTMASVYRSDKEAIQLPDGTKVLLIYHPSFWHAVPIVAKDKAIEQLTAWT